MFFAALITQAAFFAQYPRIYLENGSYNFLILLAVPTLLAWFVVLKYSDEDDQLHHLWIVWGVYVVFLLIPMVAIIYGGLRESLNSKHFFGPNILMVTTCGSPAIALILLTTAQDVAEDDDEDSIGLFTQLCGNIVLDLFDDIEILDILLFKMRTSHLRYNSVLSFLFASVCCCPLWTWLKKKYDDGRVKNRKRIYALRLFLQMFLSNVPLLIIRLVVWLMYNHNASIFIAKNLIIIVISIINMIRLICKQCCQ